MAIHIRNRNDLIKWLEENAPTRAIRRSVLEGKVENLGAFDYSDFCWIVKVVSKFDKIWYIKVTSLPKLNFNGTVLLNKPNWQNWIGDQYQNKLYRGDNPELYKELRDKK